MKKKMKLNTKYKTVRTDTIELDDEHIMEFLRLKKIITAKRQGVTNIRIYMQIPGGGDWSDEPLDVDKDHPIRVEITQEFDTEAPK